MKKSLLIAATLLPTVAFAHAGHHHLLNWQAGFLHPLTGLDHLLALLATGAWLAQSETRGKPLFLAGFAVVLILSLMAGMQFSQISFEAGIVATLVVLGALMACAIRGSLVLRALIIGATAAIHGFVHGTELPSGESVVSFAAALVLCSVMVLGLAMTAGVQSQKFARGLIARIAGVGLVLFGVGMAF